MDANMEEIESLRRAKAGDAAAFAYLVERYQPMVYNLCLRMLQNPDDAADLTQDAFVKAYQSLGKFRGESRFSTWIYRIASNLCLDEKRKRNHHRHFSLDQAMETNDEASERMLRGFQPTGDGPNPEVIAERREMQQTLQNAMSALEADFRMVLILRDVLGYEYSEIAAILDVPVGTVKSRLYRGRRLMRGLLAQNELFGSEPVKNGRGGSSDAVL